MANSSKSPPDVSSLDRVYQAVTAYADRHRGDHHDCDLTSAQYLMGLTKVALDAYQTTLNGGQHEYR